MKIHASFLFIFLFVFVYVFAQAQNRKESFQFTVPEQKISNSLYNSLTCIDARYDTSSVGTIQRGIFNDRVKLITETPFSQQLTGILNSLIDSTARNGELVLIVRQFTLAEITGSFSEKGYCYIRADLFGGNAGSYKTLSRIDSVILVKSFDVTKGLLKTGNDAISGFIAQNLSHEPDGKEIYSFYDITRIDSIEKRDLVVYHTNIYKDGVYRSFHSFVNQTPEAQITAKVKKGKISEIYLFDEKGKKEQVWQKDTYAVIYNGIPYISTEYAYYPLKKTGDDFYFTGKAKATANSTDVMMASMFFGLVGGLLASNANATFDMKIDHLNGGFIRLRETKK